MASTFERMGIALQIVQNAYGLCRDMHDNALNYKVRVTANQPIPSIASLMVADANEYLRRVKMMNDAITRNLTICTNALADVGLTIAQATSLRDTLNSVANHTLAASLVDAASINTESDFIIANVPVVERLW